MDEDKKWFDLFRVLFEMVSAFGGIGLTLGLPYVRTFPQCDEPSSDLLVGQLCLLRLLEGHF